ncbi:unnamed protein product [Sphagnum balticum]
MASVRQDNEQGQASHRGESERASASTVTRQGPTTETHSKDINCVERLSALLIILLSCSHGVLALVGCVVEWTLNFVALNGCLCTLPFRCIFYFRTTPRLPKKDASNYHTLIWQLDPREDLYAPVNPHSSNCFPVEESRRTLDVTIMASKLVYENPEVIRDVVEHWHMHYVRFYTCWNEYHQSRSTEAFIFVDQKINANAIVIVWRGTEPFNTSDWSTDIDFSFANFQDGMAVHIGFLEALGLYEIINSKKLAYNCITKKVVKLLVKHRQARLFVTGHSLGGALAAVYGAMLYYNKETEITKRLAAIYTFGQPRVGNERFAEYAHKNLGCRYKRVVYCNDIVPRLPFDNQIFQFRHFGECYYYDNWYNGWILPKEPQITFFGARITAVCEFIQCKFILPCRHGPEYKESAVSILARLAGIIVPGVVAHSPRNYVNAVRLGPYPLPKGTLETPSQTRGSVFSCLRDLVACSLGYLYAIFRRVSQSGEKENHS